MTAPRLRCLSLGAGVQSTTLALMAAHGEIEAPDCAVFADTWWESQDVYRHLAWLEKQLPFPVHRVSAGNLREDILRGYSDRSRRFASVPWFLRNPDGSVGMGRRQCTAHYKLEPIARFVVAALNGKRPRGGCEVWIGITTDEAHRMKPSRVQYLVNRWPLVEAGMSRTDCIGKLARWGVAAPKSACEGCPFQSEERWRENMARPGTRADLIAIDRAIRQGNGKGKMTGEQFMHRSCKPIDEVDFRTWAERGQPDLFGNDCEGMCGV